MSDGAGTAAERERAERDERLSRRDFVARAALLTAGLALLPSALERLALVDDALAAPADVVLETFNGLAAFVVPGRDPFSVAQGESTADPGGVEAFAGVALVQGLDFAQWFQPTLSASVATLLNHVATLVDPASASGTFAAPFANLSLAGKAAAFQILEGNPAFAPFRSLVGILPSFVGFLTYSEVGAFDPATRSLVAIPLGWTLASYPGVADGRDDFRGYFENRRRADA